MAIFQWCFFSATWSRQQQQRIPDKAATMKQFKHWQSESIGKSLRSTVVQSKIGRVVGELRFFLWIHFGSVGQMISYNIYLQFYVNYPARRNVWRTTNWPWPGSLWTVRHSTTTDDDNTPSECYEICRPSSKTSFFLSTISLWFSLLFSFSFRRRRLGRGNFIKRFFRRVPAAPTCTVTQGRNSDAALHPCLPFYYIPVFFGENESEWKQNGRNELFFFLLSPFPPRISLNIFTGNLAGAGNGCLSAAAAFQLLFAGDGNENGQ